jgi:hypothetical protein
LSILPTFECTNAPVLCTRFVIVNDRVPRQGAICAICGRKIEKGYVRESQTRLFYCGTECVPDVQRTMMAVKTAPEECYEMRKS